MVILLSRDLMLTSQVSGAASLTGIDVATVSSLEQLRERAEQGGVTGVVLDLGFEDIAPRDVMGVFADSDSRPRVIAFGPHVRTELFEAAEAAGFDAVLPRGRFVGDARTILMQLGERSDA